MAIARIALSERMLYLGDKVRDRGDKLLNMSFFTEKEVQKTLELVADMENIFSNIPLPNEEAQE